MSNQNLHSLVKGAFPRGIVSVKGNYTSQNTFKKFGSKEGSFKIQKEDQKAFLKLYKIQEAAMGKGEVALFWLFNYKDYSGNQMPQKLRAVHQGGANADLLIDKKDVEVKAYEKSFDQASKLGQFTGRDSDNPGTPPDELMKAKIVKLIQALFLIDNALNKKPEVMSDIRKFDIRQLTEAAGAMCDVRSALQDEKNKALRKIKLFQTLYERLDGLDAMFKEVNLKECTFFEGDKAGGEKIAALIIQRIIELVTNSKPKQGGFVANLNPKKYNSVGESMVVDYYRIEGKPNLDAIKVITKAAKNGQAGTIRKVYFQDQNLFLAFKDVFP